MAVPKKRTSKSKKNLRKTVWKKKAFKSAIQSYFIANSIFKKENFKEKNPAVNLKLKMSNDENTELKSTENLNNKNGEESTK
uniref:Large ribosomal subunit protein bL32c n=1 Tax=Rhexinema sarcinoideum TaxID=43261 RepID=A0A1B2RYN0_9CHLO|nr:ribosomal protein L32 [Rhexinema sarcinoideum]